VKIRKDLLLKKYTERIPSHMCIVTVLPESSWMRAQSLTTLLETSLFCLKLASTKDIVLEQLSDILPHFHYSGYERSRVAEICSTAVTCSGAAGRAWSSRRGLHLRTWSRSLPDTSWPCSRRHRKATRRWLAGAVPVLVAVPSDCRRLQTQPLPLQNDPTCRTM